MDGAGGVKLLFDQNLSHKLVAAVASDFPGSAHVGDLGMERATDLELWSYAGANGYATVSKDADFQQRALLLGHRPKVIWIGLASLHRLLRCYEPAARRFWHSTPIRLQHSSP